MSDYVENIKSIELNASKTGTDADVENVINEYPKATITTEHEPVSEETKVSDFLYSAPKKILVKRSKLKKM